MNELNQNDKYVAQIISNTEKYLKLNSFQTFVSRIKKSVIGQDSGVEALCLQVYKWLIALSNGKAKNCNAILAAPSGSGKTAFYYAVKDALLSINIPIINFDTSSITPVGYTGNDYTVILDDLCAMNEHCQGIGICFLDEFDKILIPALDSSGRDFHKEAQSCLLKMIEGSEYSKKWKDESRIYINTANTLFIGMGAFQDIRDKHIAKHKRSIGFSLCNPESQDLFEQDDTITAEDIMEHGAQIEFIGRFERVINYSKLTKESLRLIAEKIAKEIAPIPNCNISLSETVFDELLDFIDNERGVRLIQGKLSEAIDNVLPAILAEKYKENAYEIIIKSLSDVSYVSEKLLPELPHKKTDTNSSSADCCWEPFDMEKLGYSKKTI